MYGWMDGWMDGCIYIYMHTCWVMQDIYHEKLTSDDRNLA